MNFFKLYIGDYQRDTAHLSVTEHGAFLLMLQHYYATEKPLPIGKALHRMLRAQDRAEREAIDVVAQQFWRETPAGLVNDRADAEITKASAQADTNARIAREREDRRKAAREANEQSTNRATNGQPNQTPDTRHQKKTEREARASRLPPTWTLPEEWREWAAAERPDLNADRVAAKFHDHWTAKPGKAGTKLDWLATWRNWIREERAPQHRNGHNGGYAAERNRAFAGEFADTAIVLDAEKSHALAIPDARG